MKDNIPEYTTHSVQTIDQGIRIGFKDSQEGIETPILYKKLSKADFPDTQYSIREKEVQPNEEGYLPEGTFEDIKNNEIEETVVVNVGTGQGKTYNVFKIIEECHQNFIIIVAVPFLSLADKYYKKILQIPNITNDDIVNSKTAFNNYLKEEDIELLSLRRIHIVTVNLLLGNSGEKSLLQNKNKSDYLDCIIHNADNEGERVLMFFDEIHEAVHNFNPKLIFNLLKWRNIVHKIYVLSATFTESSIIVLQYLSELTRRNIYIINCERRQNPIYRLANLYLLVTQREFSGKKSCISNLYPLIPILEKHIQRGSTINILSYSKKLAEEIANEKNELSKLLKDSSKKVNLLTSNTNDIFSEGNINVGTTFKTGIDIESPDSLYIIITPTASIVEGIVQKGVYGIFSDGVPAIQQSIARSRNGGEIIIVIPKPKMFIDSNCHNRLPKHSYFYSELYHRKRLSFVEKRTYSEQKNLLMSFYEEQRKTVEPEINYIGLQDSTDLPYLQYPTFDTFVREDGQFYLTSNFPSYGKSIYPYIIWAAYHNQFANCNFMGFMLPEKGELKFTAVNLIRDLDYLFKVYEIDPDELIYDYLFIKGDELGFYSMIEIFDDYDLYLDDKKLSSWYSDSFFATALLQRYVYYSHKARQKRIYGDVDYILDQIVVAQNTSEEELEQQPNDAQNRVHAYKSLAELREQYIEMIREKSSDRLHNNFNKETINFSSEFVQKLQAIISKLVKYDVFFKNKIIKVFKDIDSEIKKKNSNSVKKLIYKRFNRLFLIAERNLNGELREYRSRTRNRQFKVLGIRPLPPANLSWSLNLLYTPTAIKNGAYRLIERHTKEEAAFLDAPEPLF